MKNLIDKIRELTKKEYPEVLKIRRYIHQNPELSFHEKETSALIENELNKLNIQYKKNIAGYGIVAKIEGGGKGKVVGLRADMDALPLQEKNDISYSSKNKGIMHACGHDAHTAMMLGVARVLVQIRHQLNGIVLLIFQPAEEKIPGGAKQMIDEGAFKDITPDLIIGQHVLPEMNVGHVGTRKGPYMASTDEIYLTVKGKGGHGGMPDLNVDSVLMAAQIIVSLQQIVSRNAPPSVPTVLSFGKIIGNGATNILPDEVKIEGTFRSMDEQWRQKAHDRITETAKHIAQSMGGDCDVKVMKGYPVLVNHEEAGDFCIEGMKQILDKDNFENLDVRMTAEDFSYYSSVCPSFFYRLGTGNVKKETHKPLHSSRFNIDEEAMKTGVEVMSWLAVKYLLQFGD